MRRVARAGDLVLTLGAGDITGLYQEWRDLDGVARTRPLPTGERSSGPVVGVLMGGYSSEREISLKSGAAVCRALRDEGFEVAPVDIREIEEDVIARKLRDVRMDVAFVALHGRPGEDGRVQEILRRMDVPYTGSEPEAHRVAIDKAQTKDILRRRGLVTPRSLVVDLGAIPDRREVYRALGGGPYVVKPSCEGSSIGVEIVHDIADLLPAVERARGYGPRVLCEEYIAGRELTVGILDRAALPVIEIRPRHGYFDFTAKYQKGETDYVIPAVLPEALAARLREIAWQTHAALGCRHFSRVDFILSEEGIPYILEINTIPGLTATSLLPMAARYQGFSFTGLCRRLVELALAEQGGVGTRQRPVPGSIKEGVGG